MRFSPEFTKEEAQSFLNNTINAYFSEDHEKFDGDFWMDNFQSGRKVHPTFDINLFSEQAEDRESGKWEIFAVAYPMIIDMDHGCVRGISTDTSSEPIHLDTTMVMYLRCTNDKTYDVGRKITKE